MGHHRSSTVAGADGKSRRWSDSSCLCRFIQLCPKPNFLLPLFQSVVEGAAGRTDQQFQPTIKRVLLSVLGDLEAVWADSALRDTLLALPLPAMAALLSCNDLKVSGSASSLHICTAVLASAGFIDSTL
jgi:hypothetical protein